MLHKFAVLLLLACAGVALAGPMPSNTLYLDTAMRGGTDDALLQAHRATVRAQAAELARLRDMMVRKGLISPRTVFARLDTFVVPGSPDRAVAAPSRAPLGQGTLTFDLDHGGWTAAEITALRSFLTAAYPLLVSVYGMPATTATLTLLKGGYTDAVEGGEFDPVNMRITLEPLPADFTSTDGSHYGMNLLHLVLHAFHAPAIIGFDAWEEGLARAAALVTIMRLRPDYDPSYDFTYLLPIYDTLNQSSLSNATFFPSQGIPEMGQWRIGMAMSAWLKVYAENATGSVFEAFNTAYYAAYAGNPGTAGSLTTLKTLLAGALPGGTVEGVIFAEWYARQYVLQPTSVLGNHIFVLQTPYHGHTSLMIHYFRTNADGSETPLSGTADLEYLTYDDIPLSPEEGNTVTISPPDGFAGMGFIVPSFFNIGDPPTQRIRISVTISGQQIVVYYPYWVRGNTVDAQGEVLDINEFFGTIVGANDGTLAIKLPDSTLQATVVQGVFGAQLTTGDLGIRYFMPVDFTVTTNGQTTTLRRNVGPWYYSPVLTVAEAPPAPLRHTFTAGTAMVSFPITPHDPDPGHMFDLGPGVTLALATWDPALPGQDKYRRYPGTPGIAPGRGYWLQLAQNATVAISGVQPGYNDPREVTLYPGWNLVGNTYNATVNPWTMTVSGTGVAARSVSQAVTDGLISPVWTYQQGAYGIRFDMLAWEGAWIYNRTTSALTLRQQGATRGARAGGSGDAISRLLGTGGWYTSIRATTATSQDTSTYLGVSPLVQRGVNALDWRKPPAPGTGVRVAFIHPDQPTAGAVYASDIRRAIDLAGETWEVAVTTPAMEQVTLSWPDLRQVPSGYQMVLEDEASGVRQYMGTTASYTYRAVGTPEVPDVRRFRVTVAPKGQAPVAFLGMWVTPSRGGGMDVRVALTGTADLLMEVRSPTGRLISRTAVTAARANDPLVIPWNGRAQGGKTIPSGVYVVYLTARTADGYIVRRAQLVQVPSR